MWVFLFIWPAYGAPVDDAAQLCPAAAAGAARLRGGAVTAAHTHSTAPPQDGQLSAQPAESEDDKLLLF